MHVQLCPAAAATHLPPSAASYTDEQRALLAGDVLALSSVLVED